MKKRSLRGLLIAFVFILCAGVAFAASTGTLLFDGTIGFADVKLAITPDATVPVVSKKADNITAGSSTGSFVVRDGTDAGEADVSVSFADVGDTVTFTFSLENISAFDAMITEVTLMAGDGVNGSNYTIYKDNGDIVVSGTYGSLNGTYIDVGESSSDVTISVKWVSGTPPTLGFKIIIDYAISDGNG